MRRILGHILLQAAAIWTVGHLLMFAAMAGGNATLDPLELLRPTVRGALALAGLVTAATLVGLRRRNEDLLLANLGIAGWQVGIAVAQLVLLLEMGLWWAVA